MPHSHLLLRCPFLLNLDLVGIANRFAQFNLPAFALGTLLLIPSAEKKAQQIQVSLHIDKILEPPLAFICG